MCRNDKRDGFVKRHGSLRRSASQLIEFACFAWLLILTDDSRRIGANPFNRLEYRAKLRRMPLYGGLSGDGSLLNGGAHAVCIHFEKWQLSAPSWS
jgi:hypothetical protein